MSIFRNVVNRMRGLSAKQLAAAGVFTLALAASVTLGLVTRQHLSAAVIRDNDPVNSIDGCYANGGIGAADANELIADINDPTCANQHLSTIYADPRLGGLTADKYTQFKNEAVEGLIWRDGHVTVNSTGETVMTDVSTMGRTTMGGKQRTPIVIGGVTYYYSAPSISFAASRQNLPVMLWFDENGVVRVAIMNPCGNGVIPGTKVTPSVTCDALQHTQKDKENKPNDYTFTTAASFGPNTHLSKVVYHFSDGAPDVTTHSLTEEVNHTFAVDGDVTVTVYATVPGNHEIHSVAVVKCKYHVTHQSPKAVCTALVPGAIDDKNQKFRFTIKVATDKNVTVKNADFTVDSKDTVTITTKDADGNIYNEYTFTDGQTHNVSALVRFTTVEGEKTDICKAQVTSKKTPVCTVPGHEGEAPNSPTCGYCLPGIPFGRPECTPPELSHTGPGNVIGLFAGTSAFGAAGHFLVSKRRASRRS